MEEIT